MTLERFLASLYMSAMLQLGMMHEQGGQPVSTSSALARRSIPSACSSEKTKGNLTPAEEGFLQNCLYELRMALWKSPMHGTSTSGPGNPCR